MRSEYVRDCVGELSDRDECLGDLFIHYILHIISVLLLIPNSSEKLTSESIS